MGTFARSVSPLILNRLYPPLSTSDPSSLESLLEGPLGPRLQIIMSKWNDSAITTEHADKLIEAVVQEHNSKQAISALPNEILSMIFTHCIVERVDVASSLEWGSPYGWLDVMLVCRWWRRVALSDPALWSHIVDRFHLPDSLPDLAFRYVSLPTIERQLLRSKRYPISAELTVDGTPESRAVLTGISHPRVKDRLRDLTLYIYCPLYARGVPPEIWDSSIRRLSVKSVTLISPPSFLDPAREGLTRMDSLSTLNITLSVDHFILRPNLKRLEIWFSFYRSWGSDATPLADLLQILAKLPNLETLWLSKCLGAPEIATEAERLCEPVQLTSLKELKLADRPDGISQILRHLSFPSSTSLELRVEPADNKPISFGSIGQQLHEALANVRGPSKEVYLAPATIRSAKIQVKLDQIVLSTYDRSLCDFPLHALKPKTIITVPADACVLQRISPKLPMALPAKLQELVPSSGLSALSKPIFWISDFQWDSASSANEKYMCQFLEQHSGIVLDVAEEKLTIASLFELIG